MAKIQNNADVAKQLWKNISTTGTGMKAQELCDLLNV